MPTYEYRCDNCATNFDLVQSFHDDALTECPTCGSPVRKVFGSVGIVFKGSGFYKNDSRPGSGSKVGANESTTPAPATADAGSGGSSDSSTSTPSTDKPATSTPAPASAAPSSAPAPAGASGASSGASTSSS